MSTSAERWLIELMADRARTGLDASMVLVVLRERGELHLAAASGPGHVLATVLPIEGSALGALYETGRPAVVDRPLPGQAEWLTELGVEARAALVEPLAIEGPDGGIIIALRHDGSFGEHDATTLSAHGARLTRQLMAERTAEVERLRYGAQARERERERWARELHDETVQGLGVLRMQLANARDSGDIGTLRVAVENVLDGLEHEVQGIRHLITELRPAALGDLGLPAALQALARRGQAVYGLDVRTEFELGPDGEQRRLDPELETTVYRVVQEALTNVSRHANAQHAVVRVAELDGAIVASVTDDGRGIGHDSDTDAGPEAAAAAPGSAGGGEHREGAPGGFGLPGMMERAELVGGSLQITSPPGQGTTVRLVVPLAGRPEVSSEQAAGV
jgi:signal transduction histidine kinase